MFSLQGCSDLYVGFSFLLFKGYLCISTSVGHVRHPHEAQSTASWTPTRPIPVFFCLDAPCVFGQMQKKVGVFWVWVAGKTSQVRGARRVGGMGQLKPRLLLPLIFLGAGGSGFPSGGISVV